MKRMSFALTGPQTKKGHARHHLHRLAGHVFDRRLAKLGDKSRGDDVRRAGEAMLRSLVLTHGIPDVVALVLLHALRLQLEQEIASTADASEDA